MVVVAGEMEGDGACKLCPKSRAQRAPRLPKFILLGSFSDTLLVVSIFTYSVIAIYSHFCSPEGVEL